MARRRARGEGSIRKRKDVRWEGRYTIGRDEETGKFIYRNVLAKTQTECKNKLHEAMQLQEQQQDQEEVPAEKKMASQQMQETADHGLVEEKSYTVGEWLNLWYEIYSKPNLCKSTQIQYKYFLKDIVAPRIEGIANQAAHRSSASAALSGSAYKRQNPQTGKL